MLYYRGWEFELGRLKILIRVGECGQHWACGLYNRTTRIMNAMERNEYVEHLNIILEIY